MRFKLQYYFNNDIYSLGFIVNEDKSFKASVIADPPREQKIRKITRFKAGLYKLGIRKEDTELTKKHRESYNKGYATTWFFYHIEVLGIQNFQGCYIHSGVDATHTDGCVLLMYMLNLSVESNQGNMSIKAVKDFYDMVYPLLEKGIECTIEVIDEH